MLSADELRDDETIDRVVAGAFIHGGMPHAQWIEWVRARAEFYAMSEDEKDAARLQMVRAMPFVRELVAEDLRQRKERGKD